MPRTWTRVTRSRSVMILCAFVAVASIGFDTPTASAYTLEIDARIVGIVTDLTSLNPIAGATINPDGNVTHYQAQAGDFIIVNISLSKPVLEPIHSIFATMISKRNEVDYAGSNTSSAIFPLGYGFGVLSDVGTGEIKANSPVAPSDDLWIQALAYGLPGEEANGGSDNAGVFAFEATGATSDIVFELAFTDGDVFLGPDNVMFSGAFVSAIPEPSTALLVSLGILGLYSLAESVRSRN